MAAAGRQNHELTTRGGVLKSSIEYYLLFMMALICSPVLIPLTPFLLWFRFRPAKIRVGLAVSDRWPDVLQFHRLAYDLAICRAGAAVETISPAHLGRLDEKLARIDALVVAGGEDVEPVHYGGDPAAARRINAQRDEMEIELLEKAADRGVPVLCVCRGAQLMAALHGGKLRDGDDRFRQKHGSRLWRLARHAVKPAPASRLRTLMPESEVNSFHRQEIVSAGGLRVAARGQDGVIEAVESEGAVFALGVQWHPELMAVSRHDQQELFNALVRAASR